MKKILALLGLLVVAGLVFSLSRQSKPVVSIPTIPEVATPTKLCYYRSQETAGGLYDRGWIRFALKGFNVTGDFTMYPAEKDSKTGTFVGTASELDQMSMSRTATLIWDTRAEGMQAKEELLISFGDGSASVAFGEMIKGANGVYVYKDKTKLSYQRDFAQVECESIDEILAVESYIRSNISTITKDTAVLGGTWYTTSIVANPAIDTALVAYEDGHIAGKGTISYSYEQTTKRVTVNSFAKEQ
jgi:hypothetical protein